MTSPWDIPKASPFLSTKEDRRNFGRNNGARGGRLPAFVLPGTPKHPPPAMMGARNDRKK